MGPSRRFLAVLFPIIIAAAFSAGRATASENQMSQRFQYGLSWRADSRFTLRGKFQGRFRESMHDFYYHETDLGVEYHPHERFRLPVAYRYLEKESQGKWLAKRYLLFDPTWRFLSLGNWDFNFRPRFQVDAGDFGLAYIRPLINATYNFSIRDHKARWWIYEDYYVQIDQDLIRNNSNPNNFSTGISWSLDSRTDIYLYYILYSSHPKSVNFWTHIHQSCFALSMKI